MCKAAEKGRLGDAGGEGLKARKEETPKAGLDNSAATIFNNKAHTHHMSPPLSYLRMYLHAYRRACSHAVQGQA